MLKDGARLEVRATFGAGVNGSRVWHSTHGLVYEAYDCGRHLVVLRTGPWLDELEGLASELEHEHNAEDAHRQAQARAEEDERFRPLD